MLNYSLHPQPGLVFAYRPQHPDHLLLPRVLRHPPFAPSDSGRRGVQGKVRVGLG